MMDYETMKTQLTGDFRVTFDKAQTYVMTSGFRAGYSDDKMMELYDLLLTAQTEQKPAEQVVGKDAAAFVQNYFSDYSAGWDERLFNFADTLRRMSIVMLVVLFLDFAANTDQTGFFAMRTNISMMLTGLLGGMVFLAVNQYVLRPASLKSKKIGNAGWAFIIIGLFVVLIGAEVVLAKDTELSVPTAAVLIPCAVYVLGYYIFRAVWRLKKYGTVKDIHKAERQDSYYTELPNRDIERAYMQGMLKRYQRLARKGKVTEEAYLGKVEREEKMLGRSDLAMTVIVLAVMIPSIVNVARESGLFDTLFFIAVLSAVEYGIWKIFVGVSRKASATRKQIYSRCSESGMTLPAYLESQVGNR